MQRLIRRQVLLPVLILLTAGLTIFTIFIVNHIRQEEDLRWQAQLLHTAQLLAEQARPLFGAQGEGLRMDNLADSAAKTLGVTVTILDSQGQIIGSSLAIGQQPQDPLELPGVRLALTQETASLVMEGGIAASQRIETPTGEVLGVIHLQAPETYYRTSLTPIFWLFPLLLLISAGVLFFISAIAKDQSLKPLEKLTLTVNQMSMGNFTNLIFPNTPAPFQDLTKSLEYMAEQLGSQIDALKGERAKLSAVLNQMTDGVLIVDDNGRVQLLNPAAERLFQVPKKSALERSVVEVLRYHQLVDLWRQAQSGERQSTMLEIGPQHLFLQMVAIPLKISLPGNTLLLIQDLTQLRKLETVRRDFISNVSHELRTPLASLKALAETLQEGALDDPPAARRFILRMETEIDNLTQLVNELLELSRIESGKVPLSFQRLKPCDLLRPAYDRMSLQAERAGLEFHLDCPAELPQVFADPDRISQVLINLIHNAIKFTPPGGKISVSAFQDNEQIIFFVRDTGVGIAKKDLSRIFERFYKADRARSGGGTGLGLSIARHMIESHGGYIWAESEEGVGSTIFFSLPTA
jgi:two-component system, OmpR family, phosphate regulon sensor histidine kinase PhoR